MDRRVYVLLLVLPFLAVFTASPAFSQTMTVTGTIKGADCVLNGTACADSAVDPKVSLERDFVLVADNGETYFLSNMNRGAKQKLVNKEVQVAGSVKDKSMFVHNVDTMMMGGMMSVWNWDLRVRNLRHPR
ncbi:hypothetical protein DSLASN_00350 [Desulfoluna limicola]|uniref:Organic solvent tolerance-like N-terminal domain-containing protein n=1 Tax=Desulfoluna limicola TaxID=2810562 RepID=A0ABN6EVP6_9BACT|nr:hypothetical protein [Desulfoluna limicola]BCS94403.1 hypothetical protein DSLASN_00350 [Desulfoluna limicola]